MYREREREREGGRPVLFAKARSLLLGLASLPLGGEGCHAPLRLLVARDLGFRICLGIQPRVKSLRSSYTAPVILHGVLSPEFGLEDLATLRRACLSLGI